MIFYLTYNDGFSGIYASQVIDVVNFVKQNVNVQIRLVAFISIRNFSAERKKIKQQLPDAIIVPMVPKLKNWKANQLTLWVLCMLFRPSMIVGRSVLATILGIGMRSTGNVTKVVYDGRGAIAAEWKEYGIVKESSLLSKIEELEKEAVLQSDFRIAVSSALVNYWKREFDYTDNKHVIIPCTVNHFFLSNKIDAVQVTEAREMAGYRQEDIVLAYSGSIAGWQSFSLLYDKLDSLLRENNNIKVLFLSPENELINKLADQFPAQVSRKKVAPEAVQAVLVACDYGILVREESVTNQVASPVKFAEYLACGLPVLISSNLGDSSKYVVANDCGFLVSQPWILQRQPIEKKNTIRALAVKDFSKTAFVNDYRKVFAIAG